MEPSNTTIAAIATPPGFGGIGIIRISGKKALTIGQKISQIRPKPRYAHHANFYDADSAIIDSGLLLSFPAPNSFTGEDIIEIQAHGGPIVLNRILQRLFELGAEAAQAGEFSQRAFLNDKLSLDQAEAIMALIHAGSEQATKAAQNSLQGGFNREVSSLTEQIHSLRIWVESAIDFPEEEIDFLSDQNLRNNFKQVQQTLQTLFHSAQSGQRLNEGIEATIIGQPNVGKSSLLNALTERDSAIVSETAGTTRDVVQVTVQIQGLSVHFNDTAGLRNSDDAIEQEGIKRAWHSINQADLVLVLAEAGESNPIWQNLELPEDKLIKVFNKIDLHNDFVVPADAMAISAKTGIGLDALKQRICATVDYMPQEGLYSVRSRHLSAIERATNHLQSAHQLLQQRQGELLAEELSLAATALGEISGQVLADDLLGDIFTKFCIGK